MAPTIDPSGTWRLSHILEGHTSDVKAVCASVVDDEVELLHSASRDESGRSWYRNKDDLKSFQKGASYQGKRYQNAITYLKPNSSRKMGR